MISSPPQEAEQIRGNSRSPESPKPVHYPSPANIPILEKQMDPMFNGPALSIGTPASFQSYPQQAQTPSAQSTASYYTEQQALGDPKYQAVASNGTVDAPTGYSQSTTYGSGLASQTQDASINSFPSQNQAAASSFSEATSTPVQDSRAAYPTSYDPNAYTALQAQAQPSQVSTGGGVNYQALLDSLSPSGTSDRYATPSLIPQSSQSQGQTPIASLPAPPNLPPRPPTQEKSTTHPNFNPNDDIRSYHPHSQKPASTQFQSPAQLQPMNVHGAGCGQSLEVHSATRSNQSPSTPNYGQRRSVDLRSPSPDDEDIRWPPQINKLYEDFLEDERKYVTDGQWDQFPTGSRLFIGNLPTEKVTKRDIFHRFFRHGKLAQISIKQAYGFVQFLDSASCSRALQAEQGLAVRGRKMHLEISKPQRNTKKKDDSHANERNNGARRRSRSPDYTRGGTVSQQRNMDRYGSNAMSPRDRDNRRIRDDYRPMRSPSPQRGGRGNRGRDRSRERYEGRRRSPSRSPRRYRSLSPRRDLEDDLPLPFRARDQIPDIQVLVVNDSLPRDYIRWVEDSFRRQGLRSDVLILSPRLSEAAVIQRQILEGVQAIVKLNTTTLNRSKVNLQVFDRRSGTGSVQFNEYVDLDPATAAALVTHAKQTQAQPVQPPAPPSYGANYGAPPVTTPTYAGAPPPRNQYLPPATANPPNLSNLISALDSNGLQQLLGAMSQKNVSQPPQPPSAGPDLARLLASVSSPTQPSPYLPGALASPQGYPNAYQQPSLASLLGQPAAQPTTTPLVQTPTQATPTGQPDMNEIMAQLAKYQR